MYVPGLDIPTITAWHYGSLLQNGDFRLLLKYNRYIEMMPNIISNDTWNIIWLYHYFAKIVKIWLDY